MKFNLLTLATTGNIYLVVLHYLHLQMLASRNGKEHQFSAQILSTRKTMNVIKSWVSCSFNRLQSISYFKLSRHNPHFEIGWTLKLWFFSKFEVKIITLKQHEPWNIFLDNNKRMGTTSSNSCNIHFDLMKLKMIAIVVCKNFWHETRLKLFQMMEWNLMLMVIKLHTHSLTDSGGGREREKSKFIREKSDGCARG